MSIGWFANFADAESYFDDERLVTTAWDDLVDETTMTKAIINAYNRIYYSPKYNVPTYAAATAEQKVILRKVNGEMAYYLAQHLDAEDHRKGLQAQGVVQAGIVKESYDKDSLDKLPIPAAVEELLDELGAIGKAMVMVPIDRDEDEDMRTDVVEED